MKHDRAFTLIEVLTSLIAGGLLLALLGWVTTNLAHDLRKPDRSARLTQIEAALPILESLIANAHPPSAPDEIITEREHLRLKVAPPAALREPGPVFFELSSRAEGSRKSLIAHFSPAKAGVDLPAVATEDRILVDGLSDVRLEYVKRSAPEPTLPALIRIVLVTSDGSIRKLAFEPRLSSSDSCIFNPVTMTCQL